MLLRFFLGQDSTRDRRTTNTKRLLQFVLHSQQQQPSKPHVYLCVTEISASLRLLHLHIAHTTTHYSDPCSVSLLSSLKLVVLLECLLFGNNIGGGDFVSNRLSPEGDSEGDSSSPPSFRRPPLIHRPCWRW